MTSVRYRPEVDGLRSVAVGGVILFHLRVAGVHGGFLGVDVFFVISGFLITAIILRELSEERFRFLNFWARRIRRIVPAMLAMVLTTLGVTLLLVFRGERPAIGAQAVAALLSVANIYFFKQTGDYWGPQAETSPLLHTWSLSVEEQFYLVLPLTLVLVHKYARRWLLGAIAVVTMSSLALFVYGASRHPIGTFYLLPTRAWELAAGAMLAAVAEKLPPVRAWQGHLATLGLVGVVASYFVLSTLGPAIILPIVGTVLILAYGGVGFCATVLGSRPVVYLGKISYSLYLWHWPITIMPEQLGYPLSTAVKVPLMFVCALLSFHLVERTTRSARHTVPVASAGLVASALLALMIARSSGVYEEMKEFNQVGYHGFYFDLKPNNFQSIRLEGGRAMMAIPAREARDDAYLSGGIVVGQGDPKLVVLGDSHGGMWSHAVRAVAERLGLSASFYVMDGVDPFFEVPPSPSQPVRNLTSEEKYHFDLARIEHIERWHPAVVIIGVRWSNVESLDLASRTVEFLRKHAGQVVLIGQPPELSFSNRLAVEQLCYLGLHPSGGNEIRLRRHLTPEWGRGQSMAAALARKYDNVVLVPTADLYLSGEEVVVARGKDVVFMDDDHLSDFGSRLAEARLFEAISAAYEARRAAPPN